MTRELIPTPENLYSFGIELEFNNPIQEVVTQKINRSKIPAKVTFDVSAQSPTVVERYTGLPVFGDTKLFETNSTTSGGELVTYIWNLRNGNENLKNLVKILSIFESMGEPPTSKTAGIHFHASFPTNLDGLKNFVTVSAHLEKFFFSAGSMGYAHRALTSDAVYYRPITRSGPIAVPVEGGWAQCFSVESLQKATSLEEFFQRYGDSNGGAGQKKYPVVRYHYVNLYNMLRPQQTVEIRVFNTTLDPLKVWAMLHYYMSMVRFCAEKSPAEVVRAGLADPISVFEASPEKLIQTLRRTINAFRITDTLVISTLERLVDNSLETTLPERYVRSHLHDRHSVALHWEGFTSIPEPFLRESDIKHPIYCDANILRGEVNPQTRYSSLSRMLSNTMTRSRPYRQLKEYEYPTTIKRTSSPTPLGYETVANFTVTSSSTGATLWDESAPEDEYSEDEYSDDEESEDYTDF